MAALSKWGRLIRRLQGPGPEDRSGMLVAVRWRRLVTKLQKSNKTRVLGAVGRWRQLARALLATNPGQPLNAKERRLIVHGRLVQLVGNYVKYRQRTKHMKALCRLGSLARRYAAHRSRQSGLGPYARWFKLGDRLRRLHDVGYRKKRAMDRWTRLAARLSGASVENDRNSSWAQVVSSEPQVRGGASTNPGYRSSIDRWRALASRLMGSDPNVAAAPRARRGGGGLKRWEYLVLQLLKQHPGIGLGEGA